MKLSASRVLLIEDDRKMPEVLAALLRDDGISLSHAADAAGALARLREQSHDLILACPTPTALSC